MLTKPIITSKGWHFSCHELRKERNKNVLDMHSPKKEGKKSKMGNFIKVKGQFSPWELALLVGLYIVMVNN